jgi:hypothetical protein
MTSLILQRLSTILRRELGAEEVRVLADDEDVEETATTMVGRLGRARQVLVRFAEPPLDMQDKRARLAILVDSFAELLTEAAAEVTRARPAPSEGLKTELSALAGRAGALHAVVLDAASPVLWGVSEEPTGGDDEARLAEMFGRARDAGVEWADVIERPPPTPAAEARREAAAAAEPSRPLRLLPALDLLSGLSGEDHAELGRRAHLVAAAIARVRRLPAMAELHRGEHLHVAVREDDLGFLARSFAGIYVLVLVYGGPFDELRAERAVLRSLPTIERLVLALPPPPSEGPKGRAGAVVALRPRRPRAR